MSSQEDMKRGGKVALFKMVSIVLSVYCLLNFLAFANEFLSRAQPCTYVSQTWVSPDPLSTQAETPHI